MTHWGRAVYNDGRLAVDHEAAPRIEDGMLVIGSLLDGDPFARWPVAEVRLIETSSDGQRVRYRRLGGDDRLTLFGGDGAAELAHACPNLHHRDRGRPGEHRRLMLWSLGAVAGTLAVFLVLIPLLARQVAAVVPLEWETSLGANLRDRLVSRLGGACEGKAGAASLDDLAVRLSKAAGLLPPVRVTVVDTKMVNALALPGGQVLIFRGLIDFAEDGGEVAGVLAHEIGHVVGRHPMTLVVERGATSLLVGLLLGDVTGGAVLGGAAELFLGGLYSRKLERAADATAIRLMGTAGYDVRPIAAFLDRMAEKSEKKGQGGLERALAWLSTHPVTEERAERVRDAAEEHGAGGESPLDWEAVRRACGPRQSSG